MKTFLIACFFSLIFTFSLFSCGKHSFEDFGLKVPLSETDMVEALQEALVLGSKTAALNLSSPCETITDCATGYLGNKLVEIAVPDTVERVLKEINSLTSKLEATGFLSAINSLANVPGTSGLGISNLASEYSSFLNLNKYVDSIKVALNRGAEQAAPKSVDVFAGAIRGMSFTNAKNVLTGDSVAATSYLRTTTYTGLRSAFSPVIKEPLDLLNPNKYWKPIASSYNKFTESYSSFQTKFASLTSNTVTNSLINTALSATGKNSNFASALPALPYDRLGEDLSATLSEYATGKALDGLFTMVGKQETSLRADPWGTIKSAGSFVTDNVGDLLGEVFSDVKEGLL